MDCRKAHITRIFKSGSAEEALNYRSISILPIGMKVFEYALHSQLYAFVQEHSLLRKNQSAFQQTHNTYVTLTKVTDIILGNMDRCLLTGAVYLNLEKLLMLLIMIYC